MPLFESVFNANEEFHKKATLWLVIFVFCVLALILILTIILGLYCSFFAKAHEYKCGHIDRNGNKCNGTPKLGELSQV